MSKTVFILGAGASADAGVPLMAGFLDAAQDLLESNRVGAAKIDFVAALGAAGELSRTHSKARVAHHNVESVFTAIEMARTIGRFGDYTLDQIDDLGRAMRRLITVTVEQSLIVPCSAEGGARPPKDYERLAALVSFLRDFAEPRHSVAVITFNYDLALDITFQYKTTAVDYALDDTSSSRSLPLLKLHGSLNWGRCSCGRVHAWPIAKFLSSYRRSHQLSGGPTMRVTMGSLISECSDEYVEPDGSRHRIQFEALPVLVPPTWNKGDYHAELASVWQRAATELSDAENIFVIGYSFPDTDLFFEYLYALGTIGTKRLRRFWVFNPDEGRKERFESLLGPGALRAFAYYPMTFGDALPVIKQPFE